METGHPHQSISGALPYQPPYPRSLILEIQGNRRFPNIRQGGAGALLMEGVLMYPLPRVPSCLPKSPRREGDTHFTDELCVSMVLA